MSPILTSKPQRIAVIGTGIAGAACAQVLARAGHAVQVFDKSRGPGGRLATRRAEWADPQGRTWETRLDHGAVAITAGTPAFQAFVDEALRAGCLAEWAPRLADHGLRLEGDARLTVPVPGMPALCRHLLGGVAATWSFAVDALHRGPRGWQVEAGGERHASDFDAVLLALPPAQAAPLLGPHRPDWARHASVAPMQACWTLMGVAAEAAPDGVHAAPPWDLSRPSTGPLQWLLRSDSRPGRQQVAGQAHWVAHARAVWSREHLEQPAAWVRAQLQAAVAEQLGGAVDWLHCEVHRWRYAVPQPHRGAPAPVCWWDAAQGLGACGDFLGGQGVEGAWLSAQLLCTAVRQGAAGSPGSGRPAAMPESALPAAAVRRQAGGGHALVQRLGEDGVNTLPTDQEA